MQRVARGVTPFQLALGAAGAFPNLRHPRVLWVGITGKLETLQALQKRLEEVLATLGFPREEHSFSPHLTLGRVRDPRQAVPGLSDGLPSVTWRWTISSSSKAPCFPLAPSTHPSAR